MFESMERWIWGCLALLFVFFFLLSYHFKRRKHPVSGFMCSTGGGLAHMSLGISRLHAGSCPRYVVEAIDLREVELHAILRASRRLPWRACHVPDPQRVHRPLELSARRYPEAPVGSLAQGDAGATARLRAASVDDPGLIAHARADVDAAEGQVVVYISKHHEESNRLVRP